MPIMKRNPLRIIGGVILGFLVLAIVSQVLRFLGPPIAGWCVAALDLSPNPQLARLLESFGNIMVLIVSVYLGIKTYKKVAGNKSKISTSL